ncbi:hypothetical protein [Ornithinimicrobium kibberense]|uniref:hypothetical protein n=1 Tax=Ornithinimicrobium kibberense TaxID=282060 RepID=UPI003611BEA7
MIVQDASHGGRGGPEQVLVGAAVGQAPVGEVLIPEGLERGHDGFDLRRRQRVQGGTWAGVDQRGPGVLAPGPAAGPAFLQPKHGAGLHQRPACLQRVVNGLEQDCLGGRVDAGRHRGHGHQSSPPFFSSRVSLTASSLTASPSRSISALASSSSTSRALLPGVPGREAASAVRAPSLATCRTRMIVDRSTPALVAACPIVASPRTSCNQISYFADADRTFFGRRFLGTEASLVLIAHPPTGVTKTVQMLLDPQPETGHERWSNPQVGAGVAEVVLLAPP